MTYIETRTLSKTVFRTTVWKCHVHETLDTETAFLDTVVYKGTRFKEKSILDTKTHFKQTESFLHAHFTSCHPPNVKKEFVKGEALRILRKNSSETTFEENNSNLKKKRLTDGGYPKAFRDTQRQFSENICSKDDLRSRIVGTFAVKLLVCLPLQGFSNM